ncbi:MAG: DUF1592 domain-containing protein [Pirellulales bacterium]
MVRFLRSSFVCFYRRLLHPPVLARGLASSLVATVLFISGPLVSAAESTDSAAAYSGRVRPLLQKYCFECHAGDTIEAEVDLSSFETLDSIRSNSRTWLKVRDMLDSGQMPPQESPQPEDAERDAMRRWVREFLTQEATARAGDPGPVVLRRLNNAQYTFTLRDLTGVDSLDPTREFPVDGAAGEGFTNAGAALVMSPALVTKYLDAAKQLAEHVVLLPHGIEFSPSTSRRDWTEERLARIRAIYQSHTGTGGGDAVNLQGIQFETNQGGRLPVEAYLAATLATREQLQQGQKTIEQVANEYKLNAKYLTLLWKGLTAETIEPSPVLDRLRSLWRSAQPGDAAKLASEVAGWQQALWKFNSIGHIGRHLGGTQGPERWMEPQSPLVARHDLRIKVPTPESGNDVVLHLATGNAGDGNDNDQVIWENPRFILPSGGELPLQDVRTAVAVLSNYRQQVKDTVAQCLAAAADFESLDENADVKSLAARHQVDPTILAAWLDWLGLKRGQAAIEGHLNNKSQNLSGYDFINGWSGPDALGIMANSSDQHVRIPGNMAPHSIAVHPSPTVKAVISWRSPVTGTVRISGTAQHAHPECGNGTAWSVELRRATARQTLAEGLTDRSKVIPIGPIEKIAVRDGDAISLIVAPRDRDHSCDLTSVDLTIEGDGQTWNLSHDISPDILAANPHADSAGHADVWHFTGEPDGGQTAGSIPAESLLAKWRVTSDVEQRRAIGQQLQQIVANDAAGLPADAPDTALVRLLTAAHGPLLTAIRGLAEPTTKATGDDDRYGLPDDRFGRPGQAADEAENVLQTAAPSVITVRVPADLVAGSEFAASAILDPVTGAEGSVQVQIANAPPQLDQLWPNSPIIVGENSQARVRWERACVEMRNLFPAVLCYYQIVPVDEVITLNLFYREDDHLQRLMLDHQQIAALNQVWDDLLFVSQEPLLLAAAYDQLVEYATQDRPDKVTEFSPMKEPIANRAANFRRRQVESEPAQLDDLWKFAARAYRRPLTDSELQALQTLYASLRSQDVAHEDAFHLTMARILVAPPFLYRLEQPPAGNQAQPVSDYELASRLSYFLWSSAPDDELLEEAAEHNLQNPEVLWQQTQRMLQDPKAGRLASEFAAQWLHIYQFDQHDEKSERHFPEFAGLKGDMYEESLRFFTDLFQHDRSVLNILDADYTFVNNRLAGLYGLPAAEQDGWRMVTGVQQQGRGGILTQASILSKQAGASRTSPILRGNWLSEVVLGEKLPRPPKNVPQLPETPPTGLTERQLIERHSSDPACVKCHQRIDPMGFALEEFDAIGRHRTKDGEGQAIDSLATLADGTRLEGLTGLKRYLAEQRRADFVKQFNRKLLGFALGRSVQLSDEPLLADMEQSLQKNEYRVSAALRAVVLSRQFREIRGQEAVEDEH